MLDMRPASAPTLVTSQPSNFSASYNCTPTISSANYSDRDSADNAIEEITESSSQGMEFSFKSKKLEALYTEEKGAHNYEAGVVKAFFDVMETIAAVPDERDLRMLPSLHLEKLKGNRKGQHSLRLNKQWRLIFIFKEDEDGKYLQIIEIADYH